MTTHLPEFTFNLWLYSFSTPNFMIKPGPGDLPDYRTNMYKLKRGNPC